MVNVLIVDDHRLFRECLKNILKSEADLAVVAEASNSAELLECLKSDNIDLITLDLSMPGISGLESIKFIRNKSSKIPILIVSMHPEDRFAIRCIKAGASGYITKERSPEELVSAIRKILLGGKYISTNLMQILSSENSPMDKEFSHNDLSDRELAVFIRLASGKKASEIAKELKLSVSTINTYRTRILEKSGFKSTVNITHYALIHGLIE
jgi:DNA-binding NarL/FixJ family response regulator